MIHFDLNYSVSVSDRPTRHIIMYIWVVRPRVPCKQRILGLIQGIWVNMQNVEWRVCQQKWFPHQRFWITLVMFHNVKYLKGVFSLCSLARAGPQRIDFHFECVRKFILFRQSPLSLWSVMLSMYEITTLRNPREDQ